MKHLSALVIQGRSVPLLHVGVHDSFMIALHVQEVVKQRGMECLAAEQNKSLMRKLADTMSTVAQATWDTKDKWMGILETMHKFITSNDPHLIEVALVLFSKLTEWLGQDSVMQNMQRQMYDILLRFLQDAPNDDIRIAACKASTSFMAVRALMHGQTSTQVMSLTV